MVGRYAGGDVVTAIQEIGISPPPPIPPPEFMDNGQAGCKKPGKVHAVRGPIHRVHAPSIYEALKRGAREVEPLNMTATEGSTRSTRHLRHGHRNMRSKGRKL